jgi:MOSC domain-containing protein YiiM
MHVISVSVGLPREVEWHGRRVRTSIFKSPVAGPVLVRRLNLDGDYQSDLTVHGGAEKAVYAYPAEHYEFWRGELPGIELPWGVFGENLTVTGLSENDLHIGDRLRIGSAEFVVTQPRMPCFKLQIRFDRADMTKRFHHSGRTGFYFSVSQEGTLTAGDTIEILGRDEHGITVSDVTRLYSADEPDREMLRRMSELPALPGSWRDYFREKLVAEDDRA